MVDYYKAGNSDDDKTLAYDLRQLDAQLTNEIKRDVAEAKKSNNYFSWIKNIEDLWDQVSHYLKDYDQVNEEFFKMLNETKLIVTRNKSEFLGQSKNPLRISEIETALRKLERFVYKKMFDSSMFGVRYEDDGL